MPFNQVLIWPKYVINCHYTNVEVPINGDRYDNRLENLRLLCPNCHSQTETYAGKRHKGISKVGRKYKKSSGKYVLDCPVCGGEMCVNSIKCRKCEEKSRLNKNTKIDWPSTKILLKMVEKESYVAVARRLGVSDNAIRKRIRKHPVK
jgi:hypothetical protein